MLTKDICRGGPPKFLVLYDFTLRNEFIVVKTNPLKRNDGDRHRIYFDYNASTPLAPEVAAAMRPFLEEAYGNPSSRHWAGSSAREAIENARGQVAALIGCETSEIIFTSGGTEANNHALKGLFFARRATGGRFHIVTSATEHPAILEPCRFLETLGAEVTRLPVDGCGRVDPDDVRRAIGPHTALISIMHANNEVGTIQPISEIAAIAAERGVICHTDAAQTVGKLAVDVNELGVGMLSVAGHKLYGPKGVGALFVRTGIELAPFMHGAGHELGRRAGTENILEIVGLGAACRLAREQLGGTETLKLRDRFWQSLRSRFGEGVVLHGHQDQRLPNTLNVSFVGQRGSEILGKLPQVAASTGSACHAGSERMSPVLEAMGVSPEIGLGAIRFSLGRRTTAAEIDSVVEALAEIVPESARG